MHMGRLALVAMSSLALAGGCAAGSGAEDDGRLRVVTTVAPITSLVAGVAGEAAVVTGTVPEGADSHTFDPPPSTARALSRADVVFVNGLGLEEPTLALAGRTTDATVVALGEEVLAEADYIFDFSFPAEEGRPNPHLWTDPTYARRYAEVIRDTLVRLDPGRAGAYRANFEAVAAAVDGLDAAVRTATATIPPERRKLLTYHDAYAYFARTYGWKVVGAIQPASFEEPTAREVVRLVEQVRAEGVTAIFGSEVFPSPTLARIGEETGAAYVDVLRDDDLPGDPGDPDHSWLGLMRFDFVTMVGALGGDPSALEAVDTGAWPPGRGDYPQ